LFNTATPVIQGSMRKRVISASPSTDAAPVERAWLDLDALADVEVTSEDAAHPVESALLPGRGAGWRAAVPGRQTVRLLFTHPQTLRRIFLKFVESHSERTQEFVLRWSPDGGGTFREILRQQWNFNPTNAVTEIEDCEVEVAGVTVLELTIVPDTSGGSAVASLERMQLA
jgi:hypothetical protein